MVVADPEATLLTACQNGYGKRTYSAQTARSAPANELPDDEDAATREKPSRTLVEPRRTEGESRGEESTRRPIATAPSAAAARGCETSKLPIATGR